MTELAGVIPAMNEADTISQVIDELEAVCDREGYALKLVVASGSTDGTDDIVAQRGHLVVDDEGKGLGYAMYKGLENAAALDPDIIFSIDADLQFRPGELPRLVDAADEYDLVLGSRFLEDGVTYDMTYSHRVGNQVLTGITNRITGLSLTDAQTGYRAMRPAVAEHLEMVGYHTYVQETIIDAARNGFTVEEVPVHFDQREHGGSRVAASLLWYGVKTFPALAARTRLPVIRSLGGWMAKQVR